MNNYYFVLKAKCFALVIAEDDKLAVAAFIEANPNYTCPAQIFGTDGWKQIQTIKQIIR